MTFYNATSGNCSCSGCTAYRL